MPYPKGLYRVCDNNSKYTVSITGAFLAGQSTYQYIHQTCNTTEIRRTYRITSDHAVDTSYSVWFTYDIQTYIDGVPESQNTVMQETIMPANYTYVDVLNVVTQSNSLCTGDDTPLGMLSAIV